MPQAHSPTPPAARRFSTRQILALFDAAHGQANWQETGFGPRLMNAHFAGVAKLLRWHSVIPVSANRKPLNLSDPALRLLVIPPPTGTYDPSDECWRRDPSTLFETEEFQTILRYVHGGGRLLAFAYRFGDSFTQSNIGQIFAALGCLLNDDAILDLHRLQHYYPLECYFETDHEMLPLRWTATGVDVLRCRSMATFTILPGSQIQPLVLSPGGSCVCYNRTHKKVSFQSHPVGVAGTYGAGRFAGFGGPHAFETSQLGLLHEVSNARFLDNVLRWLLADDPANLDATTACIGPGESRMRDVAHEQWRQYGEIQSAGNGAEVVASVEHGLLQTDILRALSLPKWQA